MVVKSRELPSVEVNSEKDIVETDLLIVGAGPAGAALACFLGQHGKWCICMNRPPG
jgi:ribulose 1,5-bisphosphate synthetase/thiazole synthase